MPTGRPWIATVPKRGYRFDGPVTVHKVENGGFASIASAPAIANVPTPADVTEPPYSAAGPQQSLSISSPGLRRKWWFFTAVSLLTVAVCIWIGFFLVRSRHLGQLASVHTIAVLPFQSAGAGAEDQYLGMGLTDALITRLGRLSQIVVRPIGAVRSLAKASDPLSAGRQLNVQAILNGTVQRAGSRTQVVVHLQRVTDGNVLWSDSFDEQNSSDFEIEDSISQKLAKALALRLSRDEQRQLATPNTPNSQAYELYIQGRYYWNKRSMESVQKSIDLFMQATNLDPNYAAAWSGLADSWILAGSYGNSFLEPSVAMPKAKVAAEKALSIDDSSAEAHTSLAYIHLMWDWDFVSAEQEFRRALQINPSYVNAHHWYSHELVALGRIAESHEQSEAALALDPTDVVINEHMAWHHMMAREYDRSIPQAKKAVELDPGFVQAHRVLGLGLLYTGRSREACYALTHREAEARKILLGLVEASTERYISAGEIAAVYAALGDSPSAIKWLDKACDERAGTLIYLNADRVWDSLRNNPGFTAELKRVNLPALTDEAPKP
jgi:TolB-like protein